MSNQIESALPNLALVFGYIAIKELPEPSEQVSVLTRLGYGNKEIAKICGLTESSVRVIKHRSNKSKRGKK